MICLVSLIVIMHFSEIAEHVLLYSSILLLQLTLFQE